MSFDRSDAVGALRGWLLWWWPSGVRDSLPAPEELLLRDGTRVWIRPILPSDRELHAANYARLSPDSKYHRFLSPMATLSEEMLDRLVDDVDGVNHVAYYVFADDEDPVESAFPLAIGRIKRDPELPGAADVAVTVQDAWHGRGVASALLPVLVARRPEDVHRIVTVVAADNPASLAMLVRLGPSEVIPIGDGVLEVRVDIRGTARRPVPPPATAAMAATVATSATASAAKVATASVKLAASGVRAPWRVALRSQDQVLSWLRPGGAARPSTSAADGEPDGAN